MARVLPDGWALCLKAVDWNRIGMEKCKLTGYSLKAKTVHYGCKLIQLEVERCALPNHHVLLTYCLQLDAAFCLLLFVLFYYFYLLHFVYIINHKRLIFYKHTGIDRARNRRL